MLLYIFAIALVVIAWVAISYNNIVKSKVLVDEGWSGIDVQLKRRYDLVSNLVETVKGYGVHEKDIFENISKMRAISMGASTIEQKSQAELSLAASLKSLFVIVESYPDLKANQSFLALQNQLTEIENEVQLSRRYYNGSARNYNLTLSTLPSMLIAKIFGFEKVSYFEITQGVERESVKVKF